MIKIDNYKKEGHNIQKARQKTWIGKGLGGEGETQKDGKERGGREKRQRQTKRYNQTVRRKETERERARQSETDLNSADRTKVNSVIF